MYTGGNKCRSCVPTLVPGGGGGSGEVVCQFVDVVIGGTLECRGILFYGYTFCFEYLASYLKGFFKSASQFGELTISHQGRGGAGRWMGGGDN